jgi:hypothetical protein
VIETSKTNSNVMSESGVSQDPYTKKEKEFWGPLALCKVSSIDKLKGKLHFGHLRQKCGFLP